MEINRALEILRALADGIDPVSGELLAAQGTFHQGDVVRALFIAVEAVKRRADAERRRDSQPANTGRRWSADEEARIREGYFNGQSIGQLAEIYARTPGAVVARLVQLGCIDLEKLTITAAN